METGELISFDEFSKVDIRVGEIKEAVALENSEKLIRFTVDFGDGGVRNILAGLKPYFEPESLVGRNFIFVLSLAPRIMAGEESRGMILCVDNSGQPLPLEAPSGSQAGDGVR